MKKKHLADDSSSFNKKKVNVMFERQDSETKKSDNLSLTSAFNMNDSESMSSEKPKNKFYHRKIKRRFYERKLFTNDA
jgi:hypothetical protein